MVLLFGALAVFSFLSIRFFEPDDKEGISVMKEQKEEQIQIYVLDKDATLIPMSKEIAADMNSEDKMKAMVQAMCVDQVNGSFSGVFGKGTQLNKVTLENGKASLFFNDQFSTYQKDQELRVLEAIVWGATQFQDIQSVSLYVGDVKLEKMPLANTPIPENANRSLGINHFESASTSLHHSDTITVFYTKNIDETSYFVPKSKRIDGDAQDMNVVVNEILKDVSASSQLTQPLYEDNIDAFDLPTRQEDTLIVNMNHNLLASDRSAKQEAYEALVLSLANTYHTDKVMVYVDENVVSLSGSNEEAISVSSLVYNPIPF